MSGTCNEKMTCKNSLSSTELVAANVCIYSCHDGTLAFLGDCLMDVKRSRPHRFYCTEYKHNKFLSLMEILTKELKRKADHGKQTYIFTFV